MSTAPLQRLKITNGLLLASAGEQEKRKTREIKGWLRIHALET
jgi:hypothetical protein